MLIKVQQKRNKKRVSTNILSFAVLFESKSLSTLCIYELPSVLCGSFTQRADDDLHLLNGRKQE